MSNRPALLTVANNAYVETRFLPWKVTSSLVSGKYHNVIGTNLLDYDLHFGRTTTIDPKAMQQVGETTPLGVMQVSGHKNGVVNDQTTLDLVLDAHHTFEAALQLVELQRQRAHAHTAVFSFKPQVFMSGLYVVDHATIEPTFALYKFTGKSIFTERQPTVRDFGKPDPASARR